MRLGTLTAGYRAFRPGDFIDKEVLGEGFFASATKVSSDDSKSCLPWHFLFKLDNEYN